MAITNIVQTRTGRMQFQGLFESVAELEALWNPASVGSNTTLSEDITILGSALGDMVMVSYEGDVQKLVLTGHVKAKDTVTVQLHNASAGAIDLAEGQIHVVILKPQHHHS